MCLIKGTGLGLLVATIAMLGCGAAGPTGTGDGGKTGSNSTTAKVLPSALTLNVDEFPLDATPENAKMMAGMPGMGNGRFCVLNGTIAHRFQALVDEGLTLAAKINDVLGQLQGSTLAGTIPVRGTNVAFKVDFSAFDIDGDGTADGSGKPNELPIAIRMWVDPNGSGQYQRLLCALITAKPDATTEGAGKLYLYPHLLAPGVSSDFYAYVAWDRTDATDKWNEGWFKGTLRGGYRMTGSHARVDLATLDNGQTQKTIRDTGTLVDNPMGVSDLGCALRTLVGLDSAIMNVKATGTNLNAQIGMCISLGDCSLKGGDCSSIDSTGMDFLAAPTGTETNWPAAFPETPTF
jgi:hypothetical protein